MSFSVRAAGGCGDVLPGVAALHDTEIAHVDVAVVVEILGRAGRRARNTRTRCASFEGVDVARIAVAVTVESAGICGGQPVASTVAPAMVLAHASHASGTRSPSASGWHSSGTPLLSQSTLCGMNAIRKMAPLPVMMLSRFVPSRLPRSILFRVALLKYILPAVERDARRIPQIGRHEVLQARAIQIGAANLVAGLIHPVHLAARRVEIAQWLSWAQLTRQFLRSMQSKAPPARAIPDWLLRQRFLRLRRYRVGHVGGTQQ